MVGLAIGLATSASSACGDAVVSASQVPKVFASIGAPVVRTDPSFVRLVDAVRRSGLGRVIGAVGYDQTQWLRSASVPGGFATWTADNAVIGFRGPRGTVHWGLRQTSDQQAWAVVADTFVNLDLHPHRQVRAAGYEVRTGAARWCANLGSPTVYGDSLTVAAGSARSTWVVTAGDTLSHVDAEGRVDTSVALTGVDRAAYAAQIGSLLVVGGRPSHLLTAPDPTVPAPPAGAPAVTGFDAASLAVRWRWGRGLVAHVVGQAGRSLIVEVVNHGTLALVALDLDGRERWRTDLPQGTTADMTLRDRIVVARSARTLSGYDAATGARRWTRELGAGQAFPFGLDLSTQPDVGAHLLVGTTTALVSIDPRTGATRTYPLPSSGSSTTFWPYEIVVSAGSAIVETNTGAVLVALSPHV